MTTKPSAEGATGHLLWGKVGRAVVVCPGEEEALVGILPSHWREGTKRMEPGSFLWCPVWGQKAKGTDWNTEGSIRTLESTVVLYKCWSNGKGCPGRWGHLLFKTWAWAPCSGGPARAWVGPAGSRGPCQPSGDALINWNHFHLWLQSLSNSGYINFFPVFLYFHDALPTCCDACYGNDFTQIQLWMSLYSMRNRW